MQEYHSGRWLLDTIQAICEEQHIALQTLSDGWLLELTKNGRTSRILGHVFDLNSSAASSIGNDKVATYELLTAYGIPAIPHHLVRLSGTFEQWQILDWARGVVVKPLTGQGGENICLFHNAKKARDFMKERHIEAWAISPLAEIVREIRLIVLDDEVIFAYAKQPVMLGGLKVFNLSKGAIPVAYSPSEEQLRLAVSVQKTIGLRLCAVDIAELETGEVKVLEVNSSVTMKKYTDYAQKNQADAKKVYSAILKSLMP